MRRKLLHICLLGAVFFVSNTPASVLYVDLNSANPTPPYADWSTAATNIQDAVDAASDGDTVLVTNGVYQTGGQVVYGSLTNRVVINKAVTVQSVNGPAVTMIQGYQVPGTINGDGAVRCVYLTNNAALIGFTLTNGATRSLSSADAVKERSGGGVWCESTGGLVSNCIMAGNYCFSFGAGVYSGTLNNCQIINNTNVNTSSGGGGGAAYSILLNSTIDNNYLGYTGGGAYSCTLSNCVIAGNSKGGVLNCILNYCTIKNNTNTSFGGGAMESILSNCIVYKNQATTGGGAYNSALVNCTVVSNAASTGAGVANGGVTNSIVYDNRGGNIFNTKNVAYTCTTTLIVNIGNFTNAPLFVDEANENFHLQTNSPCINAGKNSYVTNITDFDGNPRIVGGTVDIGAYEYQTPSSILSYAWAQQYGLPTDGSADNLDSDGDGLNNWQEWKAGTIPTNAASVLQLASPSNSVSGITVTWQSVTNVTYYLQSSTNLPAFTSIQSNIVGQAGTTSYTDTTATNGGSYFYRVGVQ